MEVCVTKTHCSIIISNSANFGGRFGKAAICCISEKNLAYAFFTPSTNYHDSCTLKSTAQQYHENNSLKVALRSSVTGTIVQLKTEQNVNDDISFNTLDSQWKCFTQYHQYARKIGKIEWVRNVELQVRFIVLRVRNSFDTLKWLKTLKYGHYSSFPSFDTHLTKIKMFCKMDYTFQIDHHCGRKK